MKFYAFLLLIMVCSCSPAESVRKDERAALDQQLEEIKAFIAEGSCDENDSCHFIAVGRKACGGPKTYMVYSSSIDVEALEEQVETYNQAEAEYNEKYDIVSDCSLVNPPENIACQDGNCVIIE